LGWLGLIATAASYLGVRAHLGKEDAAPIALLGGFLTGVVLLVSLGLAWRARRKAALQAKAGRIIRVTLTAVLCLGAGVATLLIEHAIQTAEHARCVKEAQAAVEDHLREHPHPALGDFQSMSGAGFEYPPFMSPGRPVTRSP
jgi:hypothetical protein